MNSTGSNNVFIRSNAGRFEYNSNKLIIANSSSGNPLISGDFSSHFVVINGTENVGYTFFVNGTSGGWSDWTNYSDARLKTSIVTISNALNKVQQLRGINYAWKDSLGLGNDLHMGFIAQEAEKVIPEVVSRDEKTGNYFMQYAPITAVLVEAIKEQQLQIESTKQENQQLKSELQSLKDKMDRIEAMLARGEVR